MDELMSRHLTLSRKFHCEALNIVPLLLSIIMQLPFETSKIKLFIKDEIFDYQNHRTINKADEMRKYENVCLICCLSQNEAE